MWLYMVYVEKPRDSIGENFLHMHNNLVWVYSGREVFIPIHQKDNT